MDHIEKRTIMKEENKIKKEVIEGLRLHFVFNSLNAIRFLIRKDQKKAYDAVYDLAQFLRGNVENVVSEGMIPLRDELGFACAYTNLELLQNGKLSVRWDVREIEDWVVPNGSIYGAVEKLLKEGVSCNRQKQTLLIQKNSGEDMVRVLMMETGKLVEISLCRRDFRENDENNTGG